MNVHKNARLAPKGRALLMRRICTEGGGWKVRRQRPDCRKDKRFADWRGIERAANLPGETVVQPGGSVERIVRRLGLPEIDRPKRRAFCVLGARVYLSVFGAG
jgi:hypothetical protein